MRFVVTCTVAAWTVCFRGKLHVVFLLCAMYMIYTTFPKFVASQDAHAVELLVALRMIWQKAVSVLHATLLSPWPPQCSSSMCKGVSNSCRNSCCNLSNMS